MKTNVQDWLEWKRKRKLKCIFEETPVIVHDCVEPVSNSQDCAVVELCANRILDQSISFQVDGRSSLIQNKDFRIPQECPGQTKQLSLPHAKTEKDMSVIQTNKNAFQSKAHLPLANRKSNTYNLALEWPWPWYDLDLGQVKLS